jgi:pimeloyl-ACP methyl ester carboxylesterase
MKYPTRRDVLSIFGSAAALGLARPAGAGQPFDASRERRRHTFVLIHGAWQNGLAWDGVTAALREKGHEVEAPTLPGANPGDIQSGITFADYVDAVVAVLRRQSRRAVVVAHSSAGMLLQAAAPRRTMQSRRRCSATLSSSRTARRSWTTSRPMRQPA